MYDYFKPIMMKKLILSFVLTSGLAVTGWAQKASKYIQQIQHFQAELNEEYASPETSPLPKERIGTFKGLPFYPIDSTYRVEATFVRTAGMLPFYMPTTTGERRVYEKYGEVHFNLAGKPLVLNVYQSHALREKAEYKDYLFLPFTDKTNGSETYGGGRFLDLRIPEGNTFILDFNKAYNPYCAYNNGYSCPIPPKENKLKVFPSGIRRSRNLPPP